MPSPRETISPIVARRLALARGGLLDTEWSGLPTNAGVQPRRSCYAILKRFGYLQLDTIPISGARSHSLVLLSRLRGLSPELPETLLRPKAPLFEGWAHEASWIPMELYPAWEFRRQEYRRRNPWWGPVIQENRPRVRAIKKRIRDEGPLRSADFEDTGGRSDWGYSITRRVLRSLWWGGELAVRERRNFQPYFDLPERVIPETARRKKMTQEDATKRLLLKALEGHGWATTSTLIGTWRLTKRRTLIDACLRELSEERAVVPCMLGRASGWIRTQDLRDASRLETFTGRDDEGVLLSPFDPILWDRKRVATLFNFEQVLEVFKPSAERKYGYYCMPVLAGERLVGRCDLKADRKKGVLHVLAVHHERPSNRKAVRAALERHAASLELSIQGPKR